MRKEKEFGELFHHELEQAMINYRGQTLTTKEIKNIFHAYFPNKNEEWAQPSDHCIDHSCKKCCSCAESKNALFSQIERGYYRVLIPINKRVR